MLVCNWNQGSSKTEELVSFENENEFPAGPEGGHSQAVNHVFEPTADGKAYEDSGYQVKFATSTFKTWNLRRGGVPMPWAAMESELPRPIGHCVEA